MATQVKGIDVSKYQGDIDFNKVKASGVNFVIIRAGFGKLASQKDPKFEQNYQRAKAAGLNVGAYWYSYATTAADAKTEANVCASVLAGKSFEYPIYLDIEDKCQTSTSISKAVIPAFLDTLAAKGYYVGLYSYYSFFKSYIPDDLEKKYTIWLAHYASSTSYTGHKIWQYSSNGVVNGIGARTDMNWSYVDFPSIVKASGLNGWKGTTTKPAATPTPAPATKPTTGVQEAASVKTFLSNGAKVKLVNDNLFASATAPKASSKKTGTYYIYSNGVTNGRVRVTNSASNVGKTPAGNYVTGWVDILFVEAVTGSTPAPAAPKPSVTKPSTSTGSKIKLSNAPLFASATAKTASATKSGEYYIYSGTVTNGRVRVTNSASNVGKTPAGNYVTGWVKTSDIK